MKCVVVNEPGGLEALMLTERPIPTLKKGWSLVKVEGFGINHSEIFTRRGDSPSVKFPRILGIECVGRIVQTSDPNHFQKDDRVISIMGEMGRAFDGSYAQYCLIPNDQLYKIKTTLPQEEIVALPETGYTAFGALQGLQIKSHHHVLVRGATSGVGMMFAKLLKGAMPHIYLAGSTRHLEKAPLLKEVGFDEVIEDDHGHLKTNEHFDRILELCGPATIFDSFKHANEHSITSSTGQLGNKWEMTFDPIIGLPANSYLTSFYSGNVNRERLQALFDYVEKFHISIYPEKIFSLNEVAQAHAYLESRKSFGKVIVLNK